MNDTTTIDTGAELRAIVSEIESAYLHLTRMALALSDAWGANTRGFGNAEHAFDIAVRRYSAAVLAQRAFFGRQT